jgi:hypothetical protein
VNEVSINAADLVESLAVLLEKLVEARDLFDLPPEQRDTPGAGEIGALSAVLEFCQRLPGAQENGILRPIEAALRTYLGLSYGHTPTLTPRHAAVGRAGGGPPAWWELKLFVALAMQRLMDAGFGMSAAEQLLAAKLHAAGYRQHGSTENPIDGKTVRAWRYDLLNVADDDEYRQSWRQEFKRRVDRFAALDNPSRAEAEAWVDAAILEAAPELRKLIRK